MAQSLRRERAVAFLLCVNSAKPLRLCGERRFGRFISKAFLRDELPPDLVIINVLMPVDKDFGILRQIRQQASLHNVPVIVTSSYPNSIVRSESLRAKCLAFFAKPIDFDKLNDLIEEFLSRHSNGH